MPPTENAYSYPDLQKDSDPEYVKRGKGRWTHQWEHKEPYWKKERVKNIMKPFIKEETKIAIKHIKSSSTSFETRQMQ
jgi:hypothetical protein